MKPVIQAAAVALVIFTALVGVSTGAVLRHCHVQRSAIIWGNPPLKSAAITWGSLTGSIKEV